MTKNTVVLDTNVYLSGIIYGGNCRHILDLVIDKKIESITSPAILLEIAQKLELKFHWNRYQIETVIKAIIKTSRLVYPKQKFSLVKNDKSDNKIIEAASAGGVDFIISGDKHLYNLKLEKQFSFRILKPAEYLKII